jgi:hypothetical protein
MPYQVLDYAVEGRILHAVFCIPTIGKSEVPRMISRGFWVAVQLLCHRSAGVVSIGKAMWPACR